MINAKLKKIVYSRKIRKALSNKASTNRSSTGKLGLIIEAENFEKTKRLLDIYKDLGIDKRALSIVVCGSMDQIHEEFDLQILDPKEISISGEFKSEAIRSFVQDRYDFLICHLSVRSIAGSLLAAIANAGIKVGNHPDDYGIYDVKIFSESIEDFQQEVVKYYRILKIKN